ncbi:hypothetical protein [Streptomyces sp. B21-083]|uniref:hypothetical protein n=1 Tax=Streptomyces sp. B21-083 TaxID=3039410 RepID=UPI002FF08F2A
MNATVANLAFACGLLGVAAAILAFCRWLSRRNRVQDARRAQFIRATHERARTAAVLDPVTLAEPAASPVIQAEDHLMRFLIADPDVADGFARLNQAAHDQQKGEQA